MSVDYTDYLNQQQVTLHFPFVVLQGNGAFTAEFACRQQIIAGDLSSKICDQVIFVRQFLQKEIVKSRYLLYGLRPPTIMLQDLYIV